MTEPNAPRYGLSIVVPVYRGAATVGTLVHALAALRPHGGMEVVLVNDGSPDNSGDVCRARRDEQVDRAGQCERPESRRTERLHQGV